MPASKQAKRKPPALRAAPKQERAVQTRERLLDIAGELLGEVGIERISTNMIAARAGVSPAALYRYFKDKYAILEALGRRFMDRQNAVLFAWLETHNRAVLTRSLATPKTAARDCGRHRSRAWRRMDRAGAGQLDDEGKAIDMLLISEEPNVLVHLVNDPATRLWILIELKNIQVRAAANCRLPSDINPTSQR